MTEAKTWTVLELLRWTTDHFASLGIDSPRLDAECLLSHALGTDRLRLYLAFDERVTSEARASFRELVRRRGTERAPVAQLVGTKEFWSLPLRVTRDVLTPRPETETLVTEALALMPAREAELRVLDVGTGCGAVALAIARERPKAQIFASDISGAALIIAQQNAEELGMADRIRFVEGPFYAPVAGQTFDLVVSNPPYLAESDRGDLPPELAHEPPEALFAGADGLAVLRQLVAGAPAMLAPGGSLVLEIAPNQAEAVMGDCSAAGLAEVAQHRDLAERPRVITARVAIVPDAGAEA